MSVLFLALLTTIGLFGRRTWPVVPLMVALTAYLLYRDIELNGIGGGSWSNNSMDWIPTRIMDVVRGLCTLIAPWFVGLYAGNQWRARKLRRTNAL